MVIIIHDRARSEVMRGLCPAPKRTTITRFCLIAGKTLVRRSGAPSRCCTPLAAQRVREQAGTCRVVRCRLTRDFRAPRAKGKGPLECRDPLSGSVVYPRKHCPRRVNSCTGDDPRLFNGLALSGQFGFCKGTIAFKWFRWIDFRSAASELPAIARRTSRAIAHAPTLLLAAAPMIFEED
jgi:hypothetical protein